MARTNAPILIKQLPNGTLKHFVRMVADRGESVEWEVVNHAPMDLVNVTVGNFQPAIPVTNIRGIARLGTDMGNRRGKIKADIKGNAFPRTYTFDVISDLNGVPTVIADPEVEVMLELRDLKAGKKKSVVARKAKPKSPKRK